MTVTLHHSNCLAALAKMDPESIDTVITDPPYGLQFMGKAWDHGVPGVPFWEAALRVAKPGATLLAFGGTRTHHRLMCAIEDAGWVIRDCMMWLYGSGFTKGLNISKGIDEAEGAEREVVGLGRWHSPGRTKAWGDGEKYGGCPARDHSEDGKQETAPATPDAETWDGWGTTLKPAWEPIIPAMKPLDGTFVHNALEHGVAGIWIDGGRVSVESTDPNHRGPCPAKNTTGTHGVYGRYEPEAKQTNLQSKGRWPANLILSHHPECRRVGVRKVKGSQLDQVIQRSKSPSASIGDQTDSHCIGHTDPDGLETVEAWECVEGCPVQMLDDQSGESSSSLRQPPQQDMGDFTARTVNTFGEYRPKQYEAGHADSGTASRFFYQPKAPRSEKWFYCPECDDAYRIAAREEHRHGHANFKHLFSHPTQKPLALMCYLCKLTRTPTGGTVLDMFMGSGTTGEAAVIEGRDFVGCELEYPSFVIASQSIEAVQTEIVQGQFPI